MPKRNSNLSDKVSYGSIYEEINKILNVSRVIFSHLIYQDKEVEKKDGYYKISSSILFSEKIPIEFLEKIFYIEQVQNSIKLKDNLLFPFNVIISKYRDYTDEATLKYYIKKSIRNYYHCPLSPCTIEFFHFLSNSSNKYLTDIFHNKEIFKISKLYEQFLDEVKFKIVNDKYDIDDIYRVLHCFIELSFFCRLF